MWERFRRMLVLGGRRAATRRRKRSPKPRRTSFERLENRMLLTGIPYGAAPDDTAEYMLGDVLVTVVLMESDSGLAPHDADKENWTPQLIQDTKTKIEAGLQWWRDVLAHQSSALANDLQFTLDYTYADAPVHTGYEPISRRSDDFEHWLYDFLDGVGFSSTHDFSKDIRAFNNAQRLAQGTDWAFTIFVVNSTNDYDDSFAAGGSFSMAFSYAGGRLMIVPSGRPASTYAHETGHMFWALDEYGNADYTRRRGYYDIQNLNAPHPGYTQQPSIMAGYSLLDAAWDSKVNAASTLEMIGWRDSDGDGIFDVLDVPHTLSGTGFLDPASGQYRFIGASSVQALPNLNSSGLQNDITLNKVSRAEYRIDSGDWETAATLDAPVVDLDLTFAVPTSETHTVELRTVDAISGVTSPVFQGTTSRPSSMVREGINGFVWNDVDGDGELENAEARLADWTVRLVDASGAPLNLAQTLEPDDYASGTVLSSVLPQVQLTLEGDPAGAVVAMAHDTGNVFGNRSSSSTNSTWTPHELALRMDFSTPVSRVQLDAIGTRASDRARLDVYDAAGVLLGRYTTVELAGGELETMQVQRPVADIAYAEAYAHVGAGVRLDRLRFGPETVAKTDSQGAYWLPCLPTGSYRLQAASPSGSLVTPSQLVSAVEGEAVDHIDFASQAAIPAWRNPDNPMDVVPDGNLTPLDVLTIINYINGHGSDSSPPSPPATPPPYLDVNGDGLVTPLDVLLVINAINSQTTIRSFVALVLPGSGEAEFAPASARFASVSLPAATGLPAHDSAGAPSGQVRWTTNGVFAQGDVPVARADDYFSSLGGGGGDEHAHRYRRTIQRTEQERLAADLSAEDTGGMSLAPLRCQP